MKAKVRVACSDCRFARCESYRPLTNDERQWISEYKIGDLVVGSGEPLLSEGATAPYLFTLYEGWAYRYKTLENGERQILNFCFPGDLLGLQGSMFGGLDHTVATLTECHFCVFPRDRVWDLFRSHPVLAYGLTWIASGQERLLDNRILALGKLNAESKIAHLIVSIHDRLKAANAVTGRGFRWPISQAELGDCLGMTPVHVSRMFKKLVSRQLIALSRRQMQILDMEGLQKLACYVPDGREARPYL